MTACADRKPLEIDSAHVKSLAYPADRTFLPCTCRAIDRCRYISDFATFLRIVVNMRTPPQQVILSTRRRLICSPTVRDHVSRDECPVAVCDSMESNPRCWLTRDVGKSERLWGISCFLARAVGDSGRNHLKFHLTSETIHTVATLFLQFSSQVVVWFRFRFRLHSRTAFHILDNWI